ncbi:divalent metal cation transporter [Seonamhaeicola sediminis]|uniref:Divalent metal cation transporter n=1 Tax=Seonamhaeicola sediminis TaxID=2528206 RepID=A0A562YDL4_9FLAO|nr:Nramp family divalent metal transporter [Seonamhaeicola sediminis]TWO32757.1 divalent metal cation transporter [Seonamhaeicola sediminis]
MIKDIFNNIGPGPLVAAAFIGPGTVTLCTIAGINFGFALLWAMGLSIIATVVLQEMAARLGIITQKGLSEIIRTEIYNPVLKSLTVILIISAIVIGNAAYEAGNISGGVLGLETLVGKHNLELFGFSINTLCILTGLIAFSLLYVGNYKTIERALMALVLLMSLAFLITAILTKPNIANILKGVFIPVFPEDSLLIIIGLIGTTVVPYNLFLHASLVKEKWKYKRDLSLARKDAYISVVLGGLVSMCIIISAASIQSMNISNASDLAKGLKPLFGSFAQYFLAVGLFAAGITSAITAPLAAAYVSCGCLGFKSDLKSKKFKAIWMFILVLGVLLSSLNFKPIDIIKFAQVANGILLPIIVIVLIWIMNKSSVLGTYKNNIKQNILGILILCITILLSISALHKVFGLNIF